MSKTFVISLGGSLIFPSNFDKKFLLGFKNIIKKYAKKGHKFVIICGGGKLARAFQKVASNAEKLSNEELDWLGIYATRINAHLLKDLFDEIAQDNIISNPSAKISFKKNVLIGAGWKPGWSTDYDAVLVAKNLGIKEIINMSNVNYVYDKDPNKHSYAKKIDKMEWKDFVVLINKKWKAGMNSPFDPVAAREARNLNIKVYIIGKDLANLEDLLTRKKFKGTTIG